MWYSDGSDISAQQKLSMILFADFLFMYANQCFINIMVTISPCDDKDDMFYILERLPSFSQEQEKKQEEEQCYVNGLFSTKKEHFLVQSINR